MRILDHDDGGVDHRPDGDGDAAQAHDVGVDAERPHADEGGEDGDRQHQDGDECRTQMQQEDDADQRDDQAFLGQRPLEGIDGAVDQFRTVIDRLDAHPLGQPGADFGDLGLEVVDHLQRILTVARHGDAGHHLALAVQLGQTAPLIGHQLDAADVGDAHRRAVLRLQHQILDVLPATQIAATAHHVFGLRHLQRAPADIAVGIADHLGDAHQRDAVRLEFRWIDRHLILLHEAADARHLGDPRRLGQLVAQIPVLQGAQLGQRLVLGQQHVLINPADPGGIRAERRRDALGQLAGHRIDVLQHARPRPVDVGAVLEDHVDEGGAEEGEAAHDLRLRHRQQRGGQRVGDLVLDHLRGLAREFGVQDDLDVGKIRDGVERRLDHRPDAGDDDEQRGEQYQEAVAGRPVDHGVEHVSAGARLAAAAR